MKFTAIICAVLALTLLAGCQKPAAQETPAPKTPATQTPAPQEETPTDPSTPTVPSTPTDPITITRDQAAQIALTHAGFTADQVRELETDVDRDNGVLHYEVEFKAGGYEYDYEIGTDGTVLWHTRELD